VVKFATKKPGHATKAGFFIQSSAFLGLKFEPTKFGADGNPAFGYSLLVICY
jgi:hypothetical protein